MWIEKMRRFYRACTYLGVTRYTVRSTWKAETHYIYARTLSMMEFN